MPVSELPRRATIAGVGALILLTVSTGACAKAKPIDPTVARRDRVEARLRSTFSTSQTRCILAELDDKALRALDSKADLVPQSAPFRRYSAAVTGCVTNQGTPSSTAPTGGAGPTTTSLQSPSTTG